MYSIRMSVLGIFAAMAFSGTALVQAQTPAPSPTPIPVQLFSDFQKCVDKLKTLGTPNKNTFRECSDSSRDPTWEGAPAYMCTFDYVEGDLRGLDPTTQYHEARHKADTWLCERITYTNGTRRWALYKSLDVDWTYGVADGTRIYAGRPSPVRALWQKSEIQTFYVLCPSTMEVMKQHYNGMSGGTVAWTAPPPGTTEHEPRLVFPKKHTSVSYDYFSPATPDQTSNTGRSPCTHAKPYLGQDYLGKDLSNLQNPPHNPEAPEHPSADDNTVNMDVSWKTPPQR